MDQGEGDVFGVVNQAASWLDDAPGREYAWPEHSELSEQFTYLWESRRRGGETQMAWLRRVVLRLGEERRWDDPEGIFGESLLWAWRHADLLQGLDDEQAAALALRYAVRAARRQRPNLYLSRLTAGQQEALLHYGVREIAAQAEEASRQQPYQTDDERLRALTLKVASLLGEARIPDPVAQALEREAESLHAGRIPLDVALGAVVLHLLAARPWPGTARRSDGRLYICVTARAIVQARGESVSLRLDVAEALHVSEEGARNRIERVQGEVRRLVAEALDQGDNKKQKKETAS